LLAAVILISAVISGMDKSTPEEPFSKHAGHGSAKRM
jgi:hypothetical protein